MNLATLDALMETGVSAENIVAAIRKELVAEEAKRVEKRAKDAERQRRHRLSRDVTPVTDVTRDAPVPLSPKEVSKPLSPLPPEPSSSDDGAASAPLDARTRLFREGVPILSHLTGKPESRLRPLLGKWLRDADDDAVRVFAIISEAQRDRPADAVSWIERRIPPKPPPSRSAFPAKTSSAQEAFHALERIKSFNSRPSPHPSEDNFSGTTIEASEYRRVS